jgi:hypothetical protein
MTPRSTSVRTELQLRLVVPGTTSLPVRAGLQYDVADPYAVQVTFHTGSGSDGEIVGWTFARQLLTDGVTGPVGEGDVQVWPSTSAGRGPAARAGRLPGPDLRLRPQRARERARGRGRGARAAALGRARGLSRTGAVC